jgi:hypothetical protein
MADHPGVEDEAQSVLVHEWLALREQAEAIELTVGVEPSSHSSRLRLGISSNASGSGQSASVYAARKPSRTLRGIVGHAWPSRSTARDSALRPSSMSSSSSSSRAAVGLILAGFRVIVTACSGSSIPAS